MVEHNDEFSASGPTPEGEANPGDLDLDMPVLDADAGEPAPRIAGEAPARQEPSGTSYKQPYSPPEESPIDEPKHPIFPMILGAAMLATLVIAWNLNAQSGKPAETAAATPVAAATPAPEPTPPVAPLSDVHSLKSEIDALKTDLKTLMDRVESMPRPAPAPDLAPLNTKLADISKETESLAALPKKLDDLDQRIAAFDKSLSALRGDLDTLKSEPKKAAEPANSPSTAEPARPAEDVNVADSAMDQGVDLFKAGKYKEATDVFTKLIATNPKDARVWYYAALSRGSSTKDWSGETTKLVEKGIEREKAGSPESSKIDAVFANLNPAFKPWLDTYRKSAKAR